MNIRVDLNTPINDGTEVVFRSPVDCSQITGLIVYYKVGGNTASQEFALADAHGNNVGDIDHLFAENVAVKVILDVTTGMAFVQNADTNAYLEGRFKSIEDKIGAAAAEDIVALENTLLEKENPCVLTKDSVFFQGYLSGSDFIATSGANPQRSSDFIELEPGVIYQCDYEGVTVNGTIKTYPRAIAFYDASKNITRGANLPSDMTMLELADGEKYLRLNYSDPQVNILRIYPKHLGYEPITTFNPELEVPQIKTELKRNEGNYIHARRPIIAFIFDGEYDMNADMEAKFSEHNMRVGFAPQYTTIFPNNSATTYLGWQRKGHEILAHGTYVLTGGRYTDEQAEQYIKASYERLTRYGFNIHGYIGCEGKVDEKYLPTIKRYYDYAATKINGAGDGTASTFYFGTHNPYQLWRFSLAQSTPDQCIAAVDHAMNTGGLLMFYAHARSTDNNNLTLENLETLLTHIEEVGAIVKTPYEAIKDFFSIRYEDFINQG